MAIDLPRRLAAEALGTAILVATVIGSGIMADRLSDDVAVSLLGNTLPTGAILVVLITILGPISGAHFNPAVTLVFALRREIEPSAALAYAALQIVGGIAGAFLAHAMFELPIVQISTTMRTGTGQWIAEAVAAFGLVFTILAGLRFRPTRSLGWLASISLPPTGLLPRHPSPILRSRSPALCRTRLPASAQLTSQVSLPQSCLGRCLPWLSQAGCSPSRNHSHR